VASVFRRQGYRYVAGKRVKVGEPFFCAKYNTGIVVDGVAKFAQKAVPADHATGRVAARRWADQYELEQQKKLKEGVVEEREPELAGDLIDTWKKTLTNRNADDDRGRIDRHIRPAFAHRKISDLSLKLVLAWVDQMKAGTAPKQYGTTRRGRRAEKLSGASMRANLNLLSRFCSWCVERGDLQFSPVRQIPMGRRPRQAARSDIAWLDDDKKVRTIIRALGEPVGLMFYLGNRSGLRPGEIWGLRMSDLGFLSEGVIRVRFSYDGPLKEDKHSEGKSKFVPSPDDAEQALASWLEQRRAAGAEPEDRVFPLPDKKTPKGRIVKRSSTEEAHKQYLEEAWNGVRKKLKLSLSWYSATRHSFVSRNLAAGASLDEVSAAVGHSSPLVTRRFYDHFVRKSFSPTLRSGLGLGRETSGALLHFKKPRRRTKK